MVAKGAKNPFEILNDDIFGNGDFVESASIDGIPIRVIPSALKENPEFTEIGFDTGVSFFLRTPKKDVARTSGEYVVYRGVRYRIASRETDSAGNSVHLYLSSSGSGNR